jgi:hypothetical protein
MGERGHLCLTPMLDYITMFVTIYLNYLHRLWCIWLLQPVVNEVAPLVFGGIPKAYHVGLCHFFLFIF